MNHDIPLQKSEPKYDYADFMEHKHIFTKVNEQTKS